MRSQLDVSERRACSVVGQPRATQRRHLKTPDDEAALTAAIVRLATRYRRIREMLVADGWRVNVKRVYRIWRREGLSANQATETGPAVAQRWVVRPSETRAAKPRLVL